MSGASSLQMADYLAHVQRLEARIESMVVDAEAREAQREQYERMEAVAKAARAVWDSVPASHDPRDPMVTRHARALIDLGIALRGMA